LGSPSPRQRRANQVPSGPLERIRSLFSRNVDSDFEAETPVTDMSRYVPAVTKALVTVNRDIRALTLAHLLAAGLPADIIDACQAIAGYSEAQIVQALVAVILGDAEAQRYQGAAQDIPAALRGGITIVLQTAD